MKELLEMNKPFKKYLPIYMIMLSIVLLMGTSYALLRSSHQGTNTYTMNVGTLAVTFVDSETNALTLENAYPMTDDEGMSETKELIFTVKNTGTVLAKYSVYIEETSTSPEFKSVIRYISNKNDAGYTSPKTLSSDKFIDSESSLGVSATATYKVKAWIAETADSTYMNKTFTARIVVDSIQSVIEATDASCFAYQDVTFYKYKENMTDDEVAACATFIENNYNYYLNTGDTYEDFCRNKILDEKGESIKDVFAYFGYEEGSKMDSIEEFTTKIEGIEIMNYLDYKNGDERNGACPKDVIIPNSIDDKPVIYITDTGYEDGSSYAHFEVTSIVLPDTLMEIGDSAFLNAKFKTIAFPNNLEVIGENAFKGGSLEGEFIVSGGVKTISNRAFADNKITKLTLGDNVKFIFSDATLGTPFENNQLTEIKVGNGINAINEGTFLKTSTSNPNLSKITINKTCSEIKQLPDTGGMFNYYPWLAINTPYTATGVTIYGSNNEVCDTF